MGKKTLESFSIIEKIITHFSGSANERQLLLAEMEVCNRYLKYSFDSGVINKGPCIAYIMVSVWLLQ